MAGRNYPCAMYEKLKATKMVAVLREQCRNFRTCGQGENSQYELPDVGMSAFSVFFTQSPSFLAHQRDLKLRKGRSNAENLFGLDDIPSDNQIRNLFDPVSRRISSGFTGKSLWAWSKANYWQVSFLRKPVVSGHGWDRILLLPEDPLRKLQPA